MAEEQLAAEQAKQRRCRRPCRPRRAAALAAAETAAVAVAIAAAAELPAPRRFIYLCVMVGHARGVGFVPKARPCS